MDAEMTNRPKANDIMLEVEYCIDRINMYDENDIKKQFLDAGQDDIKKQFLGADQNDIKKQFLGADLNDIKKQSLNASQNDYMSSSSSSKSGQSCSEKGSRASSRASFRLGSKVSLEIEDVEIEDEDNMTFEQFKEAANLGDAEGIYNVGCRYEKGIGVEKDECEAFRYYLEAARPLTWI
ncbi:hypothetical protein F8M41_018309 [Gigaspora margarita]|uniref:Uncharacterized protein n=1 Tax=Gigaspora margarita TaxID=4874 RepID=A0A8H4B2K6_GIGMA|nr:hypothetical protein F8M41_018309 [Gigaspora margarita]